MGLLQPFLEVNLLDEEMNEIFSKGTIDVLQWYGWSWWSWCGDPPINPQSVGHRDQLHSWCDSWMLGKIIRQWLVTLAGQSQWNPFQLVKHEGVIVRIEALFELAGSLLYWFNLLMESSTSLLRLHTLWNPLHETGFRQLKNKLLVDPAEHF